MTERQPYTCISCEGIVLCAVKPNFCPYCRSTELASRSSAHEDGLACNGVGRDAENERALCFYLNRKVTDDEMRFLHDVMRRAVACMPKPSPTQ